MAEMYKLAPVLDNVDVVPDVPMYKMASFHGEPSAELPSTPSSANADPMADLEAKQVVLLKQLAEFKARLDNFLKADAEGNKENSPTDAKAAKKAQKQAKKETHKEKKAGDAPAPNSTKAPGGKTTDLTLNLPPNSASLVQSGSTADKYSVHTYNNRVPASFQCSLECGVVDIKWLDGLVKLGKARGVEIGPKASGQRCVVVKTAKTGEVSLTGLAPTRVVGRVAVWKALGSLLQVFDPLDPLVALHTDQWLQQAEAHLSGELSLTDLLRALCRRLGEVDFLGSHGVVTLADVVLKALVGKANLASNVELWVNRVSIAH